MFGWKFTYFSGKASDYDISYDLLGLDFRTCLVVPKKRRMRRSLEFVHQRSLRRWASFNITIWRVKYQVDAEKVYRVYSVEELLESR